MAAQPPGPRQHQPPSHILIAPGTRDLVTPVSRGLAFSDFVANNASFFSWRDRSSHPWCVVSYHCHFCRQAAAVYGCRPRAAVAWTKNTNATFSSSAVLTGQGAPRGVC